MNTLVLPAITFIITIVLIVVLRPLAVRYGLTDRPDFRKDHQGDIPLIGGIAIYLAIGISLISVGLWSGSILFTTAVIPFLAATAILVVIGMLDDMRGLSPLIRFGAQIISALIMVYGAGIVLDDLGSLLPGGGVLNLGVLAVPFTVFVTVGMINALNMCDGLDGLSGNLTLVLLTGLGIANSIWGTTDHLPMLNILSAAVAGFLVFNQRNFWLNKAWVFLGDAGAMMLGLALIWSAIDIVEASTRVISPAAMLWFLAIPALDTIALMVRRIARGKSPFMADSEHLHHLFVKAGFGVGETIAYICFLAGFGCVVGLLVTWYQVPDFWVATGYVVTGLLYLWLMQTSWSTRQFLGRPLQA